MFLHPCFLYRVDESKKRRFSSAFDAPSVNMVHSKGNIFLLLNSMAFEGDHCDMCREAEQQLMEAAQQLRCAQVHGTCRFRMLYGFDR